MTEEEKGYNRGVRDARKIDDMQADDFTKLLIVAMIDAFDESETNFGSRRAFEKHLATLAEKRVTDLLNSVGLEIPDGAAQ
ncbi:hypothetical protein BH11PLA2_BH11PLA2_32650 [soil metagenome]